MVKSVNELVVRERFGGEEHFNIPLMKALMPDEFREGYINDMNRHIKSAKEYHQTDEFNCGNCSQQINSGEELIRYFGGNLHPDCFAKEYMAERDTEKVDEFSRAYFDLIMARMVLKA